MDRDLYEDLRDSPVLMQKIQDKRYAQNVYAALCNMRWQPLDVMPILKDEWWTCSWRSAGGLVAELQGEGDYMSWYCSGIGDGLGNGDADRTKGYVPEGTVTDEIREDFAALGWHPSPWPKDKD